jgi:site-specific recombinase XerD
VDFKRSLGLKFQQFKVLKAFSKFVGDADINDIKAADVQEFVVAGRTATKTQYHKYSTLRVFYRFATGRHHIKSSPLPVRPPKWDTLFVPYIYTTDDLRRLLDATKNLTDPRGRFQDAAYRALFLLLYGTGLRIGEALALNLEDVDFSERVITVRETKFYKTRLVPIGPRLAAELRTYLRKRKMLPLPKGEQSAFFASRRGNRISQCRVSQIFRLLRVRADLHREETSRYQPRLHDIRHTFAVHRIIAWYRQGRNVQRLLPLLSTYLGHVGLDSTQKYLTLTPELLQQANRRFERYALSEVAYV